MEKKFFIILIILISLLVGFFVGKISGKGKWQEKLAQTQKGIDCQKEIDWWKSQLKPFYPPLPEEIRSISGNVTEKGDNFLKMEAQIRVSQFPLPEGKEIEKKNIKVNVTDETKVFKIEMKKPLPLPPEKPFKEIVLKSEDLKVGDNIIVTSEENIKGKTEIIASEIRVAR